MPMLNGKHDSLKVSSNSADSWSFGFLAGGLDLMGMEFPTASRECCTKQFSHNVSPHQKPLSENNLST
jgi:hypothetical protein